MTYAVRFSPWSIMLFASESNRPPPAGYVPCGRAAFIAAWRQRDLIQLAAAGWRVLMPLVQP